MKYYSKRWEALPVEKGPSSILEKVLRARGVEDMMEFLHPSAPMSALPGQDKAHQRIAEAIERKEHITVIGDYDADGISSSAILSRFLRHHGLTATILLPNRYTDGYGLSPNVLSRIPADTDLLITVDCGITSVEETEALMRDMDVIITDHHEPKGEIPSATSVVNPKLDHYPFPDLSGSGVIYRLLSSSGLFVPEGLAALAMIGTIADLMPLLDENRYIVKQGLRELFTHPSAGLQAWLHHVTMDARDVRSEDISFRLAPLLNAPGRLDHPEHAFVLLDTDDPLEAQNALQECLEANEKRKVLTEEMSTGISAHPLEPAILRYDQTWKRGLVGLAASQVVQTSGRPAIFFALEDDRLIGSGRASEGFDLLGAIAACEKHLTRFGGHRQAAGLELLLEDFHAFEKAFHEEVRQLPLNETRETQWYIPLKHTEVGIYLLDELEKMEPFGRGNDPVRFLLRNMTLESIREMGRTGKAFALTFTKGGMSHRFIHFSPVADILVEGESYDILFEIKRNVFRGVLSMQLQMVDFRLRHLLPSYHEPFFIPYYEDLIQRIIHYNPDLLQESVLLPLTRMENDGEEVDFVFDGAPLPNLTVLMDPRERLQEGFIDLLPTRETLVEFYRELKTQETLDWRDPLWAARRFLSMKIFEELGIISYTRHNDRLEIHFADGNERFDLEDSLLYRQSQSILEAWSETN